MILCAAVEMVQSKWRMGIMGPCSGAPAPQVRSLCLLQPRMPCECAALWHMWSRPCPLPCEQAAYGGHARSVEVAHGRQQHAAGARAPPTQVRWCCVSQPRMPCECAAWWQRWRLCPCHVNALHMAGMKQVQAPHGRCPCLGVRAVQGLRYICLSLDLPFA
jgi:hypothetical protein